MAERGLTDSERWYFDIRGYVVLEGALDDSEVETLNRMIDDRGGLRVGAWLPVGEHFLDWDTAFRNLLVHPRILPVLRELCGSRVRLDSAYSRDCAELALHGGAHAFLGDSYYFVRDGRQYCGFTKVLVALQEANEDDGGFCCIPGSHKGAFPTPADVSIDDPVVESVPLRAGDVLVFTDSLAHGARQWVADRERRALILSYTPGMLTWSDPVLLQERFFGVMDDDEQRSLIRIPNLEHEMAPKSGYRVPSIDELTTNHPPDGAN